MNTNDEILKRLTEYEVAPPDFLSQKIFAGIQQAGQAETRLDAELKKIAGFALTPPQELYGKIVRKLGLERSRAKVLAMPAWAMAAAAAVIIAFGIWYGLSSREQETPAYTSAPAPTAPVPQSNPTAPADAPVAAAPLTPSSKPGNVPAGKNSKLPARTAAAATPAEEVAQTVLLDGTNYRIKDREYFVYLTSFNYKEVPSVFRQNAAEKVLLYTDNSTAISLSPAMVKMMKKLYTTRTGGRPTRRAEKLKKRLNKWKEADEVFFDRNLDKNPMNPVDLGSFLLDK